MFRFLIAFLPLLMPLLLSSCGSGGGYSGVRYSSSPQFINVSAYDPKERQRSGSSYTPSEQRALVRNGSLALIARCAKGAEIDTKCAEFLAGAEKQGKLLGAYYYVVPWQSIDSQARRFVRRLRQIKKEKNLRSSEILLVGDIDSKCNSRHIVQFIRSIRRLTGITPVIYLENSAGLQRNLSAAPQSHKRVIRQAPYWLALYSDSNEKLPHIKTPDDLMAAYGVWEEWAMWQYGGVFWENGRSAPKVYRNSRWPAPKYFGSMDRPMERNVFNGDLEEFRSFWKRHSWRW